MYPHSHSLNLLQKISMSIMAVLVLLTFVGANLHALLWQSSEWLISTVLPAVVIDLTNEERSDNAALPLQRNTILDEAARLKAEHMAKEQYFAHYSPAGVSPWHWFDQAGYVYAHAGENLAIHFTDSSQVVEAWMKSPTHRQNIVNNLYTEIGVGTAKGTYDGYDTVYVVQLFGTPGVPLAQTSVPVVPSTVPVPELAVSEVTTGAETEVLAATTEETLLAEESVENFVAVAEVDDAALIPLKSESEASSEPDSAVDSPEFTQQASELAVVSTEPVSEQELPVTEEIVSIEIPMLATSSGLMVARTTTAYESHAGATLVSIATQPNALLQIVYVTLGTLVIFLLIASIVIEARRFRLVQVAYGVVLIIGMGGLWFTHSLLTSGAVIV